MSGLRFLLDAKKLTPPKQILVNLNQAEVVASERTTGQPTHHL
jgi:hypothetical protein